MKWYPPSIAPTADRLVWIIEEHPKRIYPQSYTIHAGQVSYPRDWHVEEGAWRVEQGDESGCGWCYWDPEDILAWAYVEDFTLVEQILKNS